MSPRYMLIVAWVIGIGCQFTSAPATATAAIPAPASGTPTEIAHLKPTNAPQMIPDISWATVEKGDLPSNIASVQIPLHMISITSNELLGVDFSNQQVFLTDYGGKLTGFTVYFADELEKQRFTDLLTTTSHDSENISTFVDKFYSDQLISLNSKDDSLKDVGDLRNSFVVNSQSKYNAAVKLNVEVLFFIRGDIGVFLVNRYSIHTPGYKILSQVAHKLDQRIEETLRTGVPMRDAHVIQEVDVDLSWLTPSDAFGNLPDGTVQVDLGSLETTSNELGKDKYDYDNLFAFVNESGPRTLIGYNLLLNSLEEIGEFDVLITEIERILEEFTISFGGENMREYYQLYELDGAGDIQQGRSLIADVDGIPSQFSLVLFRNEQIANLLFVIQPPVPRDYNFANLYYPDIFSIRSIANGIGFLMDELFLYNLTLDTTAPAPKIYIPAGE